MAIIKNEFYIKDIFNSDDAKLYYSVSAQQQILSNLSYSPFTTKDIAFSYYDSLKSFFDSEMSFQNNEHLFIFCRGDDSSNLYFIKHGLSTLYGNCPELGFKTINFATDYIYKFDVSTKEITTIRNGGGNLRDYTSNWYCLFSDVQIFYDASPISGNQYSYNYLLSQDMQGKGQGGWQVPDPNPKAKILLNGSELTDIKLNGSTPNKIILNGVTYWEMQKQVFKRMDYSNNDAAVPSPGREVIFQDANADSTVANFYLDLKRYKFAGSQSRQWSSTTSVYSYDGSNKSIRLIWGTQSGSSQQNFDIVEVPNPSRLVVIQEWITINQGGDIEISLPSSKVTLDDIIVDFRNVSTYDTLNGGAWNEIGRSIQANKLILTFPNYFSSTSYFDIRVLCTV